MSLCLNVQEHIRSMSRSGERVIGPLPPGGVLRLGDEVTWSARHFGLRFRMTAQITEMDEPHSFIDEQTRGPFRRFRHEHRFLIDNGHTEMIDHVTFASPLGPIGALVDRVALGRYMERLIAKRASHLRHQAELGAA